MILHRFHFWGTQKGSGKGNSMSVYSNNMKVDKNLLQSIIETQIFFLCTEIRKKVFSESSYCI